MSTATDIGTLIEETPGIRGGRSGIAGTGVAVLRIAGWYKMGWPPRRFLGGLAASRWRRSTRHTLGTEVPAGNRLRKLHAPIRAKAVSRPCIALALDALQFSKVHHYPACAYRRSFPDLHRDLLRRRRDIL